MVIPKYLVIGKTYWHKVLHCECELLATSNNPALGVELKLRTAYGNICSLPTDIEEMPTK